MSSVTLESMSGFYRRKLALEFEPVRLFSTSEVTSGVYIAHVLVFAVIFLVALDYDVEPKTQTITIELSNPIDNPAVSNSVVSPSTAALPSPIALTRQQDYQVSFKKIFNGGANIESRSKQSPVNHKQIQLDEKSHLQLTKTDSRLPFKLPSPHYSKPSFSLPSPSLGTSAPLHKVDLSAPVAISMTPSVVPLPELAPSPRASQMMVTGPLPQPVLKPVQMPLSALTPIPHSQAYLQLDLAPVAAPMTESPFPMPLPASLSSATYEPPTPTSAVAPQIGSVFAFAPNVPYRASKSEPPEKTSVCHDFGDWKPYMVYLQTKIRKESIPLGEELLGHVVVVTFKLHPDGSMSDLHLQKSNAPTTLSDALLKVLERTAPFKPLPYFADGAVDIQFTFNFKSMKGKSESDL